MSLHVHALHGCAPAPLAHYLKALGVLRLVAEQADPGARGFWRDDVFSLVTTLDAQELARYFLERYSPTPMLSPWNGGSGFYQGDNKEGFDPIRCAKAPRFDAFAKAIVDAIDELGGLVEKPTGEAKARVLRDCLASWDTPAYQWLRAAFTVDSAGEPRYPALLGTGGNDRRLDFTNNYMQRLVSLFDVDSGFPTEGAESMLRVSMWRTTAAVLTPNAIGQFFPGAAGGANASSGFDGGALVNAWDFVLMLEGALVFRVASLRGLDADDLVQAAAPFALRSQASGYASASPADGSSRGEQWAPLWSQPSTLAEVRALFDEGRLHGGHGAARGTLDATRAIANLGVARGVTGFARFGYFERNGQSNLAVPLGTLEVKHRPEVRVLDELDGFVRRLSGAAGKTGAPLALGRGLRALERALMATSLPTATAETWCELIGVLGDVEGGFVAHGKSTKGAYLRPLPKLSLRWLSLLNDGSPEVRLAIAIASQGHGKLGPLRANVIPLESPRFEHFHTTADSLAKDPRVVWRGHSLVADLAAIALRRVIDATRSGVDLFPLQARVNARLEDIRLFVEARVDDAKISRLARGLLSIDWASVPVQASRTAGEPMPMHALTRVAYLPFDLGQIKRRVDAAPLRLLAAGRLTDGGQLLLRRLAGAGLRPKLGVLTGDSAFAMRLAATVAIPVSQLDAERLLGRVTKPFNQEELP